MPLQLSGSRCEDERRGAKHPPVKHESEPDTSPSVSEALRPLSDTELSSLGAIGTRWREDFPAGTPPLPIDPSLERASAPPDSSRLGRFAPISLFQVEGPEQLVATGIAEEEGSRAARAKRRLRRVLLGPPLASSAVTHERMRKLIALPVLSGDLLSSVAYGPEALVAILLIAGTSALRFEIPLSIGLVALMLLVGVSYRQTIRAYPSGAGSYIVASANLGEIPGLVAGVGLITDYVLTVAVSVAAGVAAVTSAAPVLHSQTTLLCLLVVVVLVGGNLRGVRQAGRLFASPTYIFLAAMAILIVGGISKVADRGFTTLPPPHVSATASLGLLLVMRAFASGATAMTGIEAVSNAVPVFRSVQWRNARTTLTWMVGILIVLFSLLMALVHLQGVVPTRNQTLLSELTSSIYGRGVLYWIIQSATALVLVFAADTAFNDFPRVLFYMARNDHAPRAFLRMGDRLVFSNGILVLGVLASVILLVFRGRTDSLIPLFAVGVFLAFTLSQSGMVVHWWRLRDRHWRKSMGLNALGAAASGVVLVTAAMTKFTEGAWVVVVGIPVLTILLLRIRNHYKVVERQTSIAGTEAADWRWDLLEEPSMIREAGRLALPRAGRPGSVKHVVLIPISRIDRPSLKALSYAASLGKPTLALHISPEEAEAARFRKAWDRLGSPVPLEVVVSPHRALVAATLNYVEALHALHPELTLTVVVPYVLVVGRWRRLLHSRIGKHLREALEAHEDVAVTEIPFRVSG